MIFLINRTNETLTLKTEVLDDASSNITVLVDDYAFPIARIGANTSASATWNEKYANGEKVNYPISKHGVPVPKETVQLFDPIMDDQLTLTWCSRDNTPKKYTTARDIVVVIHNEEETVSMLMDNITCGQTYRYTDEQNTYAASIFPVKWYNWKYLKNETFIYVDGKQSYRLRSIPHKTLAGVFVNAIKALNTTKPTEESTQ